MRERRQTLAAVGIAGLVLIGLANLGGDRPLPAGWTEIRPPSEVSALASDGTVVWAGGHDGLHAVDPATGERRTDLPLPDVDYVEAIVRDDAGRLWVGHRAGLLRSTSASPQIGGWEDLTARLPHGRVDALAHDGERVWVGTRAGLAVIDGDDVRVVTRADGLAHDHVSVLLADASGGIWAGSAVAPDGGISRLVDGRWEHVTVDDGLPHPDVNCLTLAPDGSVWAGTGTYGAGGAVRFAHDGQRWVIADVLTEDDGLPGPMVRSVRPAPDGTLWVGTEYAGLVHLGGGAPRVYTRRDGLSGDEVKTMLVTDDGTWWFGTDRGLTRVARGAL